MSSAPGSSAPRLPLLVAGAALLAASFAGGFATARRAAPAPAPRAAAPRPPGVAAPLATLEDAALRLLRHLGGGAGVAGLTDPVAEEILAPALLDPGLVSRFTRVGNALLAWMEAAHPPGGAACCGPLDAPGAPPEVERALVVLTAVAAGYQHLESRTLEDRLVLSPVRMLEVRRRIDEVTAAQDSLVGALLTRWPAPPLVGLRLGAAIGPDLWSDHLPAIGRGLLDLLDRAPDPATRRVGARVLRLLLASTATGSSLGLGVTDDFLPELERRSREARPGEAALRAYLLSGRIHMVFGALRARADVLTTRGPQLAREFDALASGPPPLPFFAGLALEESIEARGSVLEELRPVDREILGPLLARRDRLALELVAPGTARPW